MEESKVNNYDNFWKAYLAAHSNPLNRAFHYVGSTLAIACVVLSVIYSINFLIFAPIIGYGFAWTGHFLIEKNTPKTFGHPFWSLISDFRMLILFVTGKLTIEK